MEIKEFKEIDEIQEHVGLQEIQEISIS